MPTHNIKYTLTATGYFNQKISKDITIDVIAPKIKSFTWEVNLDFGIDNVDLKWETEESQSVEITPNVKETTTNGIVHVSISKETRFKLKAKGLFSSVEKEITAHPFPVPIVKEIFAEIPEIVLDTQINYPKNEVKVEELSLGSLEFSNDIFFDNDRIDSVISTTSLNIPEFEDKNLLFEKYKIKKLSISDIYQALLKKILKKIKNDKSN